MKAHAYRSDHSVQVELTDADPIPARFDARFEQFIPSAAEVKMDAGSHGVLIYRVELRGTGVKKDGSLSRVRLVETTGFLGGVDGRILPTESACEEKKALIEQIDAAVQPVVRALVTAHSES